MKHHLWFVLLLLILVACGTDAPRTQRDEVAEVCAATCIDASRDCGGIVGEKCVETCIDDGCTAVDCEAPAVDSDDAIAACVEAIEAPACLDGPPEACTGLGIFGTSKE